MLMVAHRANIAIGGRTSLLMVVNISNSPFLEDRREIDRAFAVRSLVIGFKAIPASCQKRRTARSGG
jgi:hypothetical protein